MGFEIYHPVSRSSLGVSAGQASINSIGRLVLASSDLHRLGINGEAVVLVDVATRRIGIRKPTGGAIEPTLAVKRGKANTSGYVNAAGAIKAIGADAKTAKGRYELMTKDNVGFVTIGVGKAR